jgi:cobalamin synthase
MIGKAKWFTRRKYLGWGLMPITWQGWAYTAVMVLPLVVMPFFQVNEITLGLIVAWFVVFGLDMILIMAKVPRDERDAFHEAIAERNALWAIVCTLAVGTAFVIAQETARGADPFSNPAVSVILAAIIAGLIVKAITNIYLDKND